MICPTDNTTFQEFAESLLVDFNTKDLIPMTFSEENWRQWGNKLAHSPTFSARGVPTTEHFSTWRKWGIMMYNTMAK